MVPQATAFTGKESEFKSVHIFDLQLETESVFSIIYQVLQNMSTSLQCVREVSVCFQFLNECVCFLGGVLFSSGERVCICVCACVFQGVLPSREAEDMVRVWEVVGELIKPGECTLGDVKL